MDTIRHLIIYFFRIAVLFLTAALVWWVVTLLFPNFSLKSLAINPSSSTSTTTTKSLGTEGWLPSPRKYSGALGKRAETPNAETNLYKPDAAFNGYGANSGQYSYTTYKYISYSGTGSSSYDGTKSYSSTGTNSTTTSSGQKTVDEMIKRSLSIRNLSLYEGGHVYTGLAFVGEARSTMFRNGKFPIVVIDQAGRLIGVSAAVATTDWTVPGWTRFETRILYTLPVNVPCTMIFEEALTEGERAARAPSRTPISIRCN